MFLTADAFGVFPPVSRLTSEQAKYHYLSGFTAKLAGTERGITEPTPTFSSCFGQAFLSLHPTQYAEVEEAECEILPYFDLAYPKKLTGVDSQILDPRKTYANVDEWDKKAKNLAKLFIGNFTKFTDNEEGKALTLAGPHL